MISTNKMVEEHRPDVREQKIEADKNFQEEKIEIKAEDVKPTTEFKKPETSKVAAEEEKKEVKKDKKEETKTEEKKDEKKVEEKKEMKDEKKDDKKQEVKKVARGPKKTEAVINGRDLRISTKHSVAVCNFIRNKDIDKAVAELEEVSKMKRAIPMRGEIPHRKGMMSGRYPINAVKEFIKLLKSLKANAMINELELEKVKLYCMPNVASRPAKRFGQGKHKRSHVQIKLIPRSK